MLTASVASSPIDTKSWSLDKTSIQELQRLKERDNRTNYTYLIENYVVFLVTMATTLWSYHYAEVSGLGAWLTVPVTTLAVIIIGGFQHQLGGAIHEGTHYILFANRKKSEIISDWFAAFPIYTTTYSFRLHHLAHHQFVNDPERDPNFAQAHMSGHWLDFPLSQFELLMAVIRQLNPILLIRYIIARARYSAIGSNDNPYADKNRMGSPWVIRIGAFFAVLMPGLCVTLVLLQEWMMLLISHIAISAAVLGYYALIPETDYPHSRLNPIISHRATVLGRMGFLSVLYASLSLICYLTGAPAWGYYLLLWILPLFSTFPLYMIAREWVQHGNADRGRLTNTRVFFVNPLIRWLVFPWGMEYHLPHHIYCSVPHYNLKKLHEILLKDPEYRENAIVVDGVLGDGNPGKPSIVEVLGPRYARIGQDISVQDETLELADVNDKEAIARHSEASRLGLSRTH